LGVPADGTGSHRVVLGGTADAFSDPDGFAWEPAATLAPTPS
ncbi:glyoxalase, partial [Streptomyces sp. NPDC002394]